MRTHISCCHKSATSRRIPNHFKTQIWKMPLIFVTRPTRWKKTKNRFIPVTFTGTYLFSILPSKNQSMQTGKVPRATLWPYYCHRKVQFTETCALQSHVVVFVYGCCLVCFLFPNTSPNIFTKGTTWEHCLFRLLFSSCLCCRTSRQMLQRWRTILITWQVTCCSLCLRRAQTHMSLSLPSPLFSPTGFSTI